MDKQYNGKPAQANQRRESGTAIVGEFDTLVDQLRDLLDTFQGRVTQYTTEMQIVSEIATQVANIKELDELLPEISEAIKVGFDLHHVNIYLVDEARENLVLRAASGEEGQKLLKQGYSVSLDDGRNQAVRTAMTDEPIISNDVSESTDFDFYDLIPGSQSKMTIPMTSQGVLVGVLAVQSSLTGRFDETDVRVKTTLGEQLAVAIESAGTFAQVQEARIEIQRSQSLLQSVLDNIPIRVFAKDLEGRYIFVNRLFMQDANVDALEDIVGKTDYEMPWAETEADAYMADDREVIESAQPKLNIEEPQTHADGSVIWLSTSKLPMRDSNGTISGVLAMYADITERKRADEREDLAYTISQQLTTLQDPRELLQFAVDLLAGALNYYHAHIYTFDEGSSALRVTAGLGAAGEVMVRERHAIAYNAPRSLVARAARTLQPVVVQDVSAEEGHLPNPLIPRTQSEAAVPLYVGTTLLGVLDVQSDQAESFDDSELRLLNVVASQLSVALSNARQFEEVERRLQDIAIINEAARIIVDSEDQVTMMEDVLALISSAIGANTAVFTEFDYVNSEWNTFASYNVSEETFRSEGRPATEYPHGIEALQTNRVVVVQDVREYEGFPEDVIERLDLRSVAAMPLIGRGESLGVAFFNFIHDTHQFNPEQVSLLEGISRQIATGVEAKRAEEANRRRLVEIQTANDAARIIAEAPDVRTMESGILELLCGTLGADNAAYVEYIATEHRWRGGVAYGMPQEIIDGVDSAYEDFPHGAEALDTNTSVAVDNAYKYEKFPMEYVESIGIKSVVAMPVVSRGRKLAVAFFNFNNDFHTFRDDEIRMVNTVARQIATGIEQKQTEEANARLSLLADNSNDFIGYADINTTKALYVNRAGMELLGYSGDEVTDFSIRDFCTPETWEVFAEEAIPQVMAEGSWEGEATLLHKDGYPVPVLEQLYMLRDDNGVPFAIATTARDIRDRLEEESKRNRIYEMSLDMIGTAGFDGFFKDLNPAWEQVLGWTPDELKAKPFIEFVHPDDVESTTAEAAKLAEGATTLSFVNRYEAKDGYYVWLSWNSSPDYEAETIYFVARDVTLERVREQQVRERARQLETVSEVATQAANTLDMDEMLQGVVDLAKERFDLYHAHVYLLEGSELVLAAGADTNGRRMKETGHHISLANENSIVASAARSGVPVRANDVTRNASFLPNPLLPKTRSELAVPLIYNREVIGVFDIQDSKPERFSNEDETIQEILAGQIAVAVQNARTFEQEQALAGENDRRARELETVAEVSAATSTIMDTDVLLKQVVDLTKEAFELYHAHIYLLNDAGDRLVLAAGAGSAGDLMKANNHSIGLNHETSIVAQCARTRAGVRVDDVVEAPTFLPNPLLPETRAEMALPMIVGDTLIGVLDVQATLPGRFTEEDLRIKSTLAAQVAIAVENARAFERNQTFLEKIAENEEQLRQFVEFSPSPVAMFNTNMEYMVASREWYSSYNLDTDAEILGLSHYEVFPDIPDHWKEFHFNVIETGEAVGNDAEEFVREDGSSSWRRWQITPWYAPGGEVGGIIMSTEDITDMVEQQRERERLLEERAEAERQNAERAREVERLKSQFLASMSHELRTPLNSIIGYSEVLLDGGDGELSEDAEEDIEIIYTSGRHLLAIINDILDLAKIEANQMKLHKEPADIVKILRDVIKTNEVLIGDKPIDLRLEAEVDQLIVPVDELRIRQVLLNLFSNAVKFTEQGSVTLELSMLDNETAKVAVRDTGIGISEEGIQIVFDQFRQVDGSSTRKAGGTGLGLPITRYLIQMHGGDIHVESEEGVGSTFWFSLPLVETESALQLQLPTGISEA